MTVPKTAAGYQWVVSFSAIGHIGILSIGLELACDGS